MFNNVQSYVWSTDSWSCNSDGQLSRVAELLPATCVENEDAPSHEEKQRVNSLMYMFCIFSKVGR